MIDLHTHTTFSDGELIPSELVRRAKVMGYTGIAITDHADPSNLEFLIEAAKKARYLENAYEITVATGVEITHVPPAYIPALARRAKELGAEIVVVHGETPAEPVMPGTNMAAAGCGDVDIIAHPGFITEEEARKAASNGIHLEITARKGHNMTNGHVARIAEISGVGLVVDTDSHAPDDLISSDRAFKVALGAGLSRRDAERALNNSKDLLGKIVKNRC
ncbi:PHP domain-containing protein [Methanocella sp. CWC-04]|uniref:PHP domain-containing protein n=1 Tax=Methanooceanicella nereidis TaxID=2052831 RepID=A0AAP2REH7_9EURY|nr:histidinol phosphate phosphatase domain-containing protein [Methanocella sp. CWC-04]MCD1296161.1 PHP domain-containing protein [Methanocella sp. CWC-04]